MRYLLYFLLIIGSCGLCYQNKTVAAQNRTGQFVIDDANMLPDLPITSAFVDVKRVYGDDMQYRYYYKTGTPTGSRTQEYITKHFIVLSNKGGYWTTIKYNFPAENITGLDSVVNMLQYAKLSALSAATNGEKVRAITREDSLRNALNAVKGTIVSETDPIYTANGVPKTRTVGAGYGVTGGGDLSANRMFSADTTSATGLVSKSRLAANLAGYIKGVQLGGGSNTFTISSLLAGATINITIPLNTTFTDNTYQTTAPNIILTGGISVLSSLSVMVTTKNTTSVVVQIRNNALLAAAVSGTVELVALKVN